MTITSLLDVQEFIARLLTNQPENKTVLNVLHLDHNRRNFNIENLVNAPQSLNMMLRKSTGHQLSNGKWTASFRVNAGKQISTASVATQAEALHAVDILKLELVPTWARQIVFDHGLNRPREFMGHYKSANSLLMRSTLYTNRAKKPEAKLRTSS